MGRTTGALVLALAVALDAGSARAQVGAFFSQDQGCVLLDGSCVPGDACATTSGVPSTCLEIPIEGGTLQQCVPDRSVFCCGLDGPECPLGTTCHLDVMNTVGFCLPDANDYCESEPDHVRITQCHTSPEAIFPVVYAEGDCDLDGLTNGQELEAGSALCTAPPLPEQLGAWIAGGVDVMCQTPISTCASVGTTCANDGSTGTCQIDDRTGEAAPLCTPPPGLFCCEGANGFVCPALTCVVPADRLGVPGVCTDPSLLCGTSEAMLRACHTAPSGQLPVPIEQGDCDGDGEANGAERETGSDPCGPGELDAGVMDAGTRTTIPPSFTGGGGARCGVARGVRAGTSAPMIFARIALAFALRRR